MPSVSLKSLKPVLALLLVYVIWGTTMGGIRIGVETIPSSLLPCIRFLLAGVLAIGLCLARKESLPSKKELPVHAIAAFLLFILGNTLASWAVKDVPTGFGGILLATTPFWMILLSAVLPPKDKITPGMWLGIIMGFIGMAVLLSPSVTHIAEFSTGFWFGVLSFMLMAFFWSAGSIYLRKKRPAASLMMQVGVQNLFAGLFLIPLCLALPETYTAFQPSMASLLALGYLVVFGTLIATPCYVYLLQETPISVSSTISYVTPVVTVLFGWLFLNEEVTQNTVIGAGIILLSVMAVQVAGIKGAKTKPADIVPLPVRGEPATQESVTYGS